MTGTGEVPVPPVREEPGGSGRPAEHRTDEVPLPGALARRIVATHRHGCVMLDRDGTIGYANQAAAELVGQEPSELVGRNMVEFMHPDDVALALEVIAEQSAEGDESVPMLWRVRSPAGPDVTVRIGLTVHDEADFSGMILRLEAYEGQRFLDDYLGALATSLPLGETLLPLVSSVRHQVQAARATIAHHWDGSTFTRALADGLPLPLDGTGAPSDDDAATPWATVVATGEPSFAPTLDSLPRDLRDRVASLGFHACWAWPVVAPPGADVVGSLIVWRQVPGLPFIGHSALLARTAQLAGLAFERRRTEELLLRAATFDGLTGVANRTHFFTQLEALMADEEASGTTRKRLAVLYLDLDDFKPVNDTHGHLVGDELLAVLANELSTRVRPGDLFARMGGDEFAVLCPEVPDEAAAVSIAERLLDAVRQPVVVSSGNIRVGMSIGVAVVGHGAVDLDGVLVAADRALYQAKHAGRGGWHLAGTVATV